MRDDSFEYHDRGAYVNVGRDHAFTLSTIWDAVDDAECLGISPSDMQRALEANWDAAVIAIVFRRFADLRALAGGWP